MAVSTEKTCDYTQGFGSFHFAPPDSTCFDGRVPEPDEAKPRPAGPRTRATTRAQSVSRFPFMKFPLEIRRRIYKCVTEELRGNENQDDLSVDRPNSGIRFYVVDRTFDAEHTEKNDTYTGLVEGAPDQRNVDHRTRPDDTTPVDLFEMYKAIRAGEFEDDDPNIPSNWQNCRQGLSDYDSETEAESSHAGDDSDWDSDDAEIFGHPGNSAQEEQVAGNMIDKESSRPRCAVTVKPPVELTCMVHGDFRFNPQYRRRRPSIKCECKIIERSVYKDIRHLAQSSRLVAVELGQVLWENATVEFDGPETFCTFAAERPTALSCLNGIVLGVDCSSAVVDTRKEDLEAMLGIISERLDLRWLGVKLHTVVGAKAGTEAYDSHDENSETSQKLAEWAPLFRGLNTRTFAVKVVSLWNTRSKEEEKTELQARVEGVRKRVEGIWMPDCIRERDEQRKEEKEYLLMRESLW